MREMQQKYYFGVIVDVRFVLGVIIYASNIKGKCTCKNVSTSTFKLMQNWIRIYVP
jgi:hypothetical protein